MKPTAENAEDLARSFVAVRKAIGYLGAFLPASLFVMGTLDGDVAPSISDFYFTNGRDLFVGTLFAIAVFFLAYTGHKPRGHERLSDFWTAKIAGVAVLGVAFIPTAGPAGHPLPLVHRALGVGPASALHYASAGVFFTCLAIFSLVLFRRGRGRPERAALPADERRAKEARDKIYLGCGIVICLTIALMVAHAVFTRVASAAAQEAIARYDLIFWLETIGVLAFALSWLTKGETLLARPIEKLVEKARRAPG